MNRSLLRPVGLLILILVGTTLSVGAFMHLTSRPGPGGRQDPWLLDSKLPSLGTGTLESPAALEDTTPRPGSEAGRLTG